MYECYERSPTPNRPEGAAWDGIPTVENSEQLGQRPDQGRNPPTRRC
ncbi:hypothetical protein I553_1608 [Mycobacterium xenopi 4042]|uniref:Uncharacterized protein n=1 Tax=Mycobacterium xenopi 4042 TaxID=1299334 RepID=X8CFF7_MYCXE|nr:hypothetical protein I553_1608 [Mycobacterium xenopi 4042]